MINVVVQYTFFGEIGRNKGRMQHIHSPKKDEAADKAQNTV
ncbi:hypothetical protein [Loigolactobacillus coryniformis]|nr:hypothetical protein [Loigolactobacillus coryniformis]